MTYLDIVNNTLRRLRESTVSDITETTYSTMVGDFVNDAKKLCEDSWDWSALRTDITVTTSSGTSSYSLTNSGESTKVLYALNDTKNWFMEYQTQKWFDDKYSIATPADGSPNYYTFDGIDSSDDTKVKLYPKPNATESVVFTVIKKPVALSAKTDTLSIPHQPVIHMAVALLARERGETGGTTAAEYYNLANKYLTDAIAFDASKHPEETIWYTP